MPYSVAKLGRQPEQLPRRRLQRVPYLVPQLELQAEQLRRQPLPLLVQAAATTKRTNSPRKTTKPQMSSPTSRSSVAGGHAQPIAVWIYEGGLAPGKPFFIDGDNQTPPLRDQHP